MSPIEAVERARRIWGAGQVVRVAHAGVALPPPRITEWDVELHSGSWHGFDCNGHPTCHQECDEVSVLVTT